MSSIDEFLESCNQILNDNIGFRSKRIIEKAKSKKILNDTSDLRDFEEFINILELDISVISGKNNAVNICSAIKSKAIELNISKQAMDIFNALRTETTELSIGEFLKKINVADVCTFRKKVLEITDRQEPLKFSINKKMEEFLEKHTLPTESVINKFATYLAYKFCEDVKRIKKEIIGKVRIRVKNILIRKAIREEIKNLLTAYPMPTKSDVDDFVKHISFSKLNVQEAELRQQILDEILYRKFYESQNMQKPSEPAIEESSEIATFLDIIRTNDDKKDISKELHRLGIIYLIQDESGLSDKLLDEYINLIRPD